MHASVPHAQRQPAWTLLALTVFLHLLLVLAWRWQAQTAPSPAPALPERLIELVPPRPPVAPVQPALTPRARALPSAPLPQRPRPAESAPAVPADAVPAEAPVIAETPPMPAEPAREAPLTLAGEDMLAASKRSAAAFDREERKGKSGVPLEADTPWSRFRSALAAAHVDRSMSMRMEKYASPDGVVIYRTTQGGKQTCHMTGAVVFGPGRAGGGSAAGSVACPKGVSWERM